MYKQSRCGKSGWMFEEGWVLPDMVELEVFTWGNKGGMVLNIEGWEEGEEGNPGCLRPIISPSNEVILNS